MDADELRRENIRREIVHLAVARDYPDVCNKARLWVLDEFGEMNPGLIRERIPSVWWELSMKN